MSVLVLVALVTPVAAGVQVTLARPETGVDPVDSAVEDVLVLLFDGKRVSVEVEIPSPFERRVGVMVDTGLSGPTVNVTLDARGTAISSGAPSERGAVPVDRGAVSASSVSTGVRPDVAPGRPPASEPLVPEVRAPGKLAMPSLLVVGTVASAVSMGAVLFRRLSEDEIVDQEVRAQLLDEVARDPASNASELADRLDVTPNTVLYHARILRQAGRLSVRRRNGEVLLFSRGAFTPTEEELLAALRSRPKRELLELVRSRRGIRLSSAACRLGMDRANVKRVADELVDRGVLVEREGAGRCLDVAKGVFDVLDRMLGEG